MAAFGCVERRVLDVVAHALHELFAHRFHVHEGAAVCQPELPVVVVVDAAAEVHEVVGRPDVELDVLEDRGHNARLELHGPLHAR